METDNEKNETLLLLTDHWCDWEASYAIAVANSLWEENNYDEIAEFIKKIAQVVTDGGFITANETAAVEFAYEIFKILKVDSDSEMEIWFDNFNNGAIR